MRVVIIGGVAGGATAATRLRRLKEACEIVMLERGSYVSFANCGLPYYVGNIIKERTTLELVTPKTFLDRFNIDVRINSEAISIDKNSKVIKVKDLTKLQKYDLNYDYLIIATGSSPIVPPFPGLESVPHFTISTIPDSIKTREFIEKFGVKEAVIIGGGFIGLEVAENLVKKGIKVHIIEMLDQVMPPLDKEMAQFVHNELVLNGVFLRLKDPVESFGRTKEQKSFVKTKSGLTIEADLFILAVGVKPESALAKVAGLEVGPKGYIVVNERMQTSDPSIYAVGDAVQIASYVTHKPVAYALAGPANKQGRIAADNIAGKRSIYSGILGASVVKVFDATVASVGLTEKQLKETSLKYEKVYLHPNNHAGYYPGAIPMALKLLFEVPTGKVLGAQIVGGPGAEKRTDVISTVIKYNGTVFDLEELELTYAPPYNSAKDPVNMAGFVAANYLRGDIKLWQWHDIDKAKENGAILLDVRTAGEYKKGTIPGAINISVDELRHRLKEVPKDRPIVAFCGVGYRSYIAVRMLAQHGFKETYELTGGFKLYDTATKTIEQFVEACGSS